MEMTANLFDATSQHRGEGVAQTEHKAFGIGLAEPAEPFPDVACAHRQDDGWELKDAGTLPEIRLLRIDEVRKDYQS